MLNENEIVVSLKQAIWGYDDLSEREQANLLVAYLTGRIDRFKQELEELYKKHDTLDKEVNENI